MRRSLLPLVLLLGCGGAPEEPAANPLQAPPVDTARIRLDDAVAWDYHRELSADLDGDGRMERVVIASDATLDAAGQPLWEDGHRWAVYAESPAGERTLLYGGFVPNGFAEAAVLAEQSDGGRGVLVQVRTPGAVQAVEVEYGGPGVARTASSAHYQVEGWLPGSASMPSPPPTDR